MSEVSVEFEFGFLSGCHRCKLMKKKHKRVIVQYYAILLTFGLNRVIHQVLQTGATGHQFPWNWGQDEKSGWKQYNSTEEEKKDRSLNCPVFFKAFQLWIKFLAHITLQELLYMCLNARECQPLSSLRVLESLTKSSYLWALVWSSIPCFIPNLSVSLKWLKSGTLSFHGTGFSWEDLQDLILTGLDVMKSMSSSQAQVKEIQSWGWNSPRTNSCEKDN